MDDCGGEMMGHVMNLLMANGAKERCIIHRFIRRRTDRPIR